jgi:hypothetical protein
MHLQIDKVILHTNSISRLSQFITQLFELSVEVDQLGQSFCDFGNLRLYFLESGEVRTHQLNFNSQFVFQASSLEELNEFKQKLEFYYYREGIDYSPLITQSMTSSQLYFIDPDHRTWLLECPRATQSLPVETVVQVY